MEFLSPGHYRSEAAPQTMSIAGVSMATGAVVSTFERGPIGVARLVHSLTEFQSVYGSRIASSYGYQAVEGAYRNCPGMRLWVVRTGHYTDVADRSTLAAKPAGYVWKDRAGTPVATLEFRAANEGAWGNSISVTVADATVDSAARFKALVKLGSRVVEVFDELSLTAADAEHYVESRINGISKYITVADKLSATVAPNNRPSIGTNQLMGGEDGLAGLSDNDYVGSPAGSTGLHALDPVDENLTIIVPGVATSAVHDALTSYCEVRGDCFAILDCPAGLSAAEAVNYVRTTAQINSEYTAIYWPWVGASDPVTGAYTLIPPSGHLLGAYGRTITAPGKGPWKTPAGIEDGRLFGALGVADDSVATKSVRDTLYQANVNPIRAMAGYGRCAYGARLCAANKRTQFINERLTFNYVEKSIENGTQWAEFENNDAVLWARLTRSITAFLLRVWRAGGLKGETPEEAFAVKIDAETNPEPVTSTCYGRIGIAAQTPAEFIWFEYSKHTYTAPAEPEQPAE